MILLICLVMLLVQRSLSLVPKSLYVNCSTSTKSSGTGTSTDPCPSLSCALSQYTSSSGSNITVYIAAGSSCSGIGNENIVVNGTGNNYNFYGQGLASDVIIESSSFGNRAFFIDNVINVTMKNITLRNFYYVPDFNEDTVIEDSGGAIVIINTTSVSLQNMMFYNNSALLGGSVSLSSIKLGVNVVNCIFENNTGMVGGGAMLITYSNADIIHSTFLSNQANDDNSESMESLFYEGSGGAVLFYDDNDNSDVMTIIDSTFTSNSAFSRGGAVYYRQSNDSAKEFLVYSSTFNNNSVFQTSSCVSCDLEGGAVYIDSRTAYFEDNTFDSNYGGLTSNTDGSTDDSNIQVARGGAVYATWSLSQGGIDSVLTIVACNFQNNHVSSYGGALYLFDVNANITANTYFVGNIVGSTVGSNLFLDFPTLGGALYFGAKTLSNSSVIQDCYFLDNKVVGGWGGAIYASETSVNMLITNTLFSNNIAYSSYTFSSQGGAVMLSSISASFVKCTFSYNSAQPIFLTPYTFSGYGGAMFAQSAVLDIYLCLFTNNYAFSGNEFDSGSSGGAIFYIHSFDCDIVQTNFTSNAAVGYLAQAAAISAGKGGAIFLKFSSVQISQNSVFYRNWASSSDSQGSEGGAIAVYESYSAANVVANSTISDTTFIQNVAVSSVCDATDSGFGQGGAVAFSDTSSFYFVNVTFIENVAQSSLSYISSIEAIGGAIAVISKSFISISISTFEDNSIFGSGFGDDISVLPDSSDFGFGNLTVVSTLFSNTNVSVSWTASHGGFALFGQKICADVTAYTKQSASYLDAKFNTADNKYMVSNRYRELNRKLDELKSEDALEQQHRQQRRVLRAELRDFLPASSILLSSGYSFFNSPTFNTCPGASYEVFVGNVIDAVDTSNSVVDDSTSQLTIQQIQAGGNNMRLLVFQGTLIVEGDSKLSTTVVLDNIYLINSTLSTSNNLTILGRSYLIASTINRCKTISIGKHALLPQINFKGSIITGLGLGALPLKELEKFPKFLFNSSSVYDGVNVSISGNISILPPLLQAPTVKITTYVYLRNNASINLEATANMKLLGGTLISSDSESLVALTNSGTITLQGSNEIYDLLKDIEGIGKVQLEKVLKYLKDTFNFDYTSYEGNGRSIFSPLSVSGIFEQSKHGFTVINLFNNGSTVFEIDESPVLYLTSNQSLLGNIELNILSNTRVTLASTALLPTTWGYLSFKNAARNSAGSATIATNVPGFAVSQRTLKMQSSWVTYLEASSLACEDIAAYYFISTNQELCSVCSMNSSCSICATDAVPHTYSCVTKGQCLAGQSEQPNCCYNCDGPGVDSCQANGGGTPTCVCKNNFVYSPSHQCQFPGLGIKIFLSLLGSFIFLLLLGVLNHRYNKGQKGKVIEELRQNLLNSQDGINSASTKTLKVIQSLQQDLILKDVSVKYEDLKLESKIGEGSYGVVYKATFRGAQVAVKQMRSPLFVDLTQNDIEEFRKEAYMMSRLRHPNIVLVMGISLIDIEPTRRRILSTSERTESGNSSKAKKESKKTVCIITEYLEQGSLADILYGPSRLPADVWNYELILTCALQAARGMLYLHSHTPPICHRDLKCSNLVVDDHWVVKVTDFGMSRIVPEKIQDLDIGVTSADKNVEDQLKYFFGRETDANSAEASSNIAIDIKDSNRTIDSSGLSNSNLEMTSNLGTTAWCAPELFTAGNTARYSVKVDVYSFGMVLWELWEKRRPYDDLNSRFDIMDAVREGRRPRISDNCPPAYRSLIERCWESEPSRRPMFKYIVRYLKEELAQVKRIQTTVGPNRTVSTDNNARSAYRVGDDLEDESPSSFGRANFNKILGWNKGKEDNAVPSSRTPLTIFNKGLGHLASSPAVASSEGTLAEQQSSFTSRGTGGAGGGARGVWRDKYVMKFSGWKTTQPDVGLPPSLGQTGNPIITASSPYNNEGNGIFDMETDVGQESEIQLSSSNRSNK